MKSKINTKSKRIKDSEDLNKAYVAWDKMTPKQRKSFLTATGWSGEYSSEDLEKVINFSSDEYSDFSYGAWKSVAEELVESLANGFVIDSAVCDSLVKRLRRVKDDKSPEKKLVKMLLTGKVNDSKDIYYLISFRPEIKEEVADVLYEGKNGCIVDYGTLKQMQDLKNISTGSSDYMEILKEGDFEEKTEKIVDAVPVALGSNKPYSMYELQNKPPKWVSDLELWDHIVETVTNNGTKEVKVVVPLSIYKRKLAAKQAAMAEVEDSGEEKFAVIYANPDITEIDGPNDKWNGQPVVAIDWGLSEKDANDFKVHYGRQGLLELEYLKVVPVSQLEINND